MVRYYLLALDKGRFLIVGKLEAVVGAREEEKSLLLNVQLGDSQQEVEAAADDRREFFEKFNRIICADNKPFKISNLLN